MAKQKAEPKKTFDLELIRDISEGTYRIRLEQDCRRNVEWMLEKDADGGVKLRGRASSYDAVTRAYLEVLGFTPDNPPPAVDKSVWLK